MSNKFFGFVLLIVFFVCQITALYDRYNDDDYLETSNHLKPLTSEQLTGFNEYLSRKLNEESIPEFLNRNTRYSNENSISKRDTLWTTTEVLQCVQRLKLYKDNSKLDLVSEILNCYQRLKHAG